MLRPIYINKRNWCTLRQISISTEDGCTLRQISTSLTAIRAIKSHSMSSGSECFNQIGYHTLCATVIWKGEQCTLHQIYINKGNWCTLRQISISTEDRYTLCQISTSLTAIRAIEGCSMSSGSKYFN